MAQYTRSKVFHPVFGYPEPILENQLPTKLDLYNHYSLDCMTTSKNIVKQKRNEAQYEREEKEIKNWLIFAMSVIQI